jgi:hypothetical protein
LRQQSEANSNEVYVTPLHGQKVTVWSGISEFSIIDSFEDETGNYVSVTSDRYVHIADEFLFPELRNRGIDIATIWFQKDAPTAHSARQSMNTLRPGFKHRIISRYGDISGSTSSPDYDFFLWGYFKSKVFQIRPADSHDLTDRQLLMKSVPSDRLCYFA